MNRRKAWICVLHLSATHLPAKPDRNVYHALELLGGHPTTGEEFSGYDETQLKELEEKLRQQFGNRG